MFKSLLLKEHKIVETEPSEPVKLYPIFHRTLAKINKLRINTTGKKEATEFAEKEDAHCISTLLTYENTKILEENSTVQGLK